MRRRSTSADGLDSVFVSPEAREIGLGRRRYQLDAARQIVRFAEQRRSSELRLPTGTGKTLIAHLAALLWRERHADGITLIVVPRRVLATQHNRMAAWLRDRVSPLLVTDEVAANPARLAARAERAGLIIGLPGLLSRCFETMALPRDVAQRIGLRIIDEFDEFLFQDYHARGISVRFDRDFENLHEALPAELPSVIMSGTAPGGAAGAEAIRLADFVKRTFRPAPIAIAPRAYATFSPTARIHVKLVRDQTVALLDGAIGTDLMFAINELCGMLRGYVDENWLFPRLPGLLAKPATLRAIRLRDGRTVSVNGQILKACSAVQAAVTRSVFLQEDMFEGYTAATEEFLFFAWDSDEPKRLTRPRFIARPPENEYRPALHGKFAAALELARTREKERGVVFVRYVQLAEAIAACLRASGLAAETLHGDMRPQQQSAAQERFAGRPGLLIMTRDTGKRGLDLPQAEYAIFYSPKASEVTSWQELSRIRSNVGRTKDSYFLAYAGTREEQRLADLIGLMETSGRAYKILRRG